LHVCHLMPDFTSALLRVPPKTHRMILVLASMRVAGLMWATRCQACALAMDFFHSFSIPRQRRR
jgi:hypothetical protein